MLDDTAKLLEAVKNPKTPLARKTRLALINAEITEHRGAVKALRDERAGILAEAHLDGDNNVVTLSAAQPAE